MNNEHRTTTDLWQALTYIQTLKPIITISTPKDVQADWRSSTHTMTSAFCSLLHSHWILCKWLLTAMTLLEDDTIKNSANSPPPIMVLSRVWALVVLDVAASNKRQCHKCFELPTNDIKKMAMPLMYYKLAVNDNNFQTKLNIV